MPSSLLIDLEFTGERVVPGKVERALWQEHVARYLLACGWVRGKRVLDFGCGAGYGSDLLAAAGAERVMGCDIALDAVRYAAERYSRPGLDFMVTDCLVPGLRAHSFDVVVSFEAIEHVDSHERYLAAARQLLVEDGMLIISTPNKASYEFSRGGVVNPFHVHELELDEFRQALAAYFGTVSIFGQSTCEGPLFVDLAAAPSDSEIELLVEPGPDVSTVRADYDFFVAVCSVSSRPLPKTLASRYFTLGDAGELSELRQRLLRLQAEFEERTRWAQDLDRQLTHRSQQLMELRGEFEERTAWAHSLDAENTELKAHLKKLSDRSQRGDES